MVGADDKSRFAVGLGEMVRGAHKSHVQIHGGTAGLSRGQGMPGAACPGCGTCPPGVRRQGLRRQGQTGTFYFKRVAGEPKGG